MDLSSISKILNDSTDGHRMEGIAHSPTSQFEDASCVCSSSWESMASGSALQSFLDHISIDPITKYLNTSVLELKHDDCIQYAIRSLYEKNVFGAPIVNSVSSDRRNFIDRDIGFIEFSSMVLWSLEEFDKASAESKSDSHGFLSMLEQISQIGETKVGELARFFLWEPFFPASPGDSLLRVLLLFSKHRKLKVVPVVESSNSCVVSFITQGNPKIIRFKRNLFHQYEIFEKICAENIAVGDVARSSNKTQPTMDLGDDETPQFQDDFLTANGVSYDMEGTPESNQPITIDDSPIVGSKRSSEKSTRNTKCPKNKGGVQNLSKLLIESNKQVVVFKEALQRTDPFSMGDCLEKLGRMNNLTVHGLIAVQDALKENKDNKTVFMTWEGDVLKEWIEHIVGNHPRFYASQVWL